MNVICGLDFLFIFALSVKMFAIKSLHLPQILRFEAWLGITTLRGFPEFDKLSRKNFFLRSPFKN